MTSTVHEFNLAGPTVRYYWVGTATHGTLTTSLTAFNRLLQLAVASNVPFGCATAATPQERSAAIDAWYDMMLASEVAA